MLEELRKITDKLILAVRRSDKEDLIRVLDAGTDLKATCEPLLHTAIHNSRPDILLWCQCVIPVARRCARLEYIT